MTPDALDSRIRAWEERLARVDANLVALESEPTYQVLSRPGGMKASLEGVTRQRVVPALDAMDRLFESRGRLTAIVEQAKEERARVSTLMFWENDEHLHRATELLEGRSIRIGSAPTPLSRRELLDAAISDVAVTPEELLGEMTRNFETARDAVAALSRAWSELEPALEAAEAELLAVRDEGSSLPPESAVAREISAAGRDLAHARRRVAVDPLGAETSFVHVLRPRVEALRKRVTEGRELRRDAEQALSEARIEWEALESGCARARAAMTESSLRFTGATLWPEPSDAASLVGMREWLDTLEQTAKKGHWAPARVGLGRWREAAREYAAKNEAVWRDAQAREAWRGELAGRVTARRAQARALFGRAAAAPTNEAALASQMAAIDASASRLEARLAACPVDVGETERAFDAFENAIDELRALAR